MSAFRVAHVYTDAGLCGTAPTRFGGSWSFIFVDAAGAEVYRDSGPVRPTEHGMTTLENNFLETFAVLRAMEVLPPKWAGPIYCDNANAIRRATYPKTAKMGGVPLHVVARLRVARERLGELRFVLLGGHPTRDELKAGRRKDGKPVSAWNVACDAMCTQVAATLR